MVLVLVARRFDQPPIPAPASESVDGVVLGVGVVVVGSIHVPSSAEIGNHPQALLLVDLQLAGNESVVFGPLGHLRMSLEESIEGDLFGIFIAEREDTGDGQFRAALWV